MKKRILTLFLIICILLCSEIALAHSGRTDAQGGHRDNKNKSGLGYYHYHHGCPPHLHTGGHCPYGYGSVYDDDNYSYDNDNHYHSNDSYSNDNSYSYYPESIKIKSNVKSIDVGEETDIKVSLSPSSIENDKVVWLSSNNKIAKVDEYGTVTAIKPGTVTISAKTENDIVAKLKLVIKGIELEALEIENERLEITVGESETLELMFLPENATNTEVEWSSSDESILTVDENGIITAVGEGTATVTAFQEDIKTECSIQVYPMLEAIDIERGETKIKIKRGESETIDVDYFPYDVLDKNVILSTDYSGSQIIKITDNSIRGICIGETTLTVTASNGVRDTIIVEVYSYDNLIIFAITLVMILITGIAVYITRKRGIF